MDPDALQEYMESTAGEGPEFEFASKYATIGHRPADAVLVAIPSAVLLQKIAQTLRMLGLEVRTSVMASFLCLSSRSSSSFSN